jgi:hypothetical protein
MRYRLMATYQGVPYEAGIGPSDGDVVLFAACPPPEDLGFEPATGHWRKQLRVQDVQALWESRPMGRYRGQRCMVLDDLGDRLHIAYLGHDAYQALQLGYWQVDRGVFELVTPRDEVTDVTEERFDYPEQPLPRDDYHPAAADSGPATADFGASAADSGPATADFGPLTPDYEPAMADYRAPSADYGPVTAEFGVLAQPGLAPAPVLTDTGPFSSPGRRPASPGQPRPPAPELPPPGFTVIPPASEPPLPLEAAALRAASAAARPKQSRPAAQDLLAGPAPASAPGLPVPAAMPVPAASPVPSAWPARPELPTPSAPPARPDLAASPDSPPPESPLPATAPRRRRSARSRMATQGIFIELATLAAIPAAAYAVGEEVDGALCLIETATGYEVFSAAGGARHEVRVFEDEESAYFYLFGVLAAEAVRTGLLVPHR